MTMIVEPAERNDWETELLALVEDHGGEITPEIVLEHAKKTASAMHGLFTWDDSEAAKQYRILQAGGLIRRIKVKMITKDEDEIPVRALHVVTRAPDADGKTKTAYMPLRKILESPELSGEMLLNAKRELSSFRRKYAVLQELTHLISAIDDVLAMA